MISFVCDGDEIAHSFAPPAEANVDGSFDVNFTEGGRNFHVTGTFSDQDNVSGSIDDAADRCDESFDAARLVPTPTPSATPTQVEATPTAGPAETGNDQEKQSFRPEHPPRPSCHPVAKSVAADRFRTLPRCHALFHPIALAPGGEWLDS